ncbi:MAG: hypothetical protein WC931_05190, partial [Bacilli bacterium]
MGERRDDDHHGTESVDERISVRLVEALAAVWSKIREHHPGVPGVVLLAAPSPRRELNVLGHFAALCWSARQKKGNHFHEVVVVAEHLDREVEAIVGTLIHEAAHALNFERHVFDCSRSQYHNRQFKEAAEELGLTVEQVLHYGFAKTRLTEKTIATYAIEIANLNDALVHRRKPVVIANPAPPKDGNDENTGDRDADNDKSTSRHLKAICACDPPFIIRVSCRTLRETRIICAQCGEEFGI